MKSKKEPTLTDINDNIIDINRNIVSLNGRFDSLQEQVTDLRDHVSESIQGLATHFDARFDALQSGAGRAKMPARM